jgi:peptidylprolyl isomerase
MKLRHTLPLLLAVLALPATAADTPAGAGNKIVARMGAVEISAAQLKELINLQPPAVRRALQAKPDAQRELLQAELLRRQVLAEARKLEWDKRPGAALLMERAREQGLIDSFLAARSEPDAAYPSAQEIEAFYKANSAQFKVSAQVKLAQILVRIPETASKDEVDRISLQAREVWNKLNKGANFATLVTQHSEDEGSKDKGGDLGWVPMDAVLPNIRVELPHVKVGDYTRPIRSQFGWQIIRVNDRKPESQRPLAEVRENIAEALRANRSQQERTRFMEALKARDKATIDERQVAELFK